MNFESISVIGMGYIGLPTAAVFASRKKKVIGVDVDQQTVEIINKGEIHIVEPDLDIVVHAAVTEGYLRATTIPKPADAFLIAVPTPFKENHEPDLSFIKAACLSIAPVLKPGNLVVLESTSPVGATEEMTKWLRKARPDLTFPDINGESSDIRIAHCPERVLPGYVIRELIENDRVIGGLTPKCSEAAVQLYKTFVQGECVVTNARTAEMVKLTENSFRDVNIAFANELSIISDKLNIDVWELINLANRHPRVNILQPGPGVGGHCIAVDPWFIVSKTPNEARIIRTARNVNDNKPLWVLNKLKQELSEIKNQKPSLKSNEITIACYGLAFKADIDDLRESPAMMIVEEIAEFHTGNLLVVEPNIKKLPRQYKRMKFSNVSEALQKADIHLFLVDHTEFKTIDILELNGRIIDTKGIFVADDA